MCVYATYVHDDSKIYCAIQNSTAAKASRINNTETEKSNKPISSKNILHP